MSGSLTRRPYQSRRKIGSRASYASSVYEAIDSEPDA